MGKSLVLLLGNKVRDATHSPGMTPPWERACYLSERGRQTLGQLRLAAAQRQAARAQCGLQLRDGLLQGRRIGLRLRRAVALEHLQAEPNQVDTVHVALARRLSSALSQLHLLPSQPT